MKISYICFEVSSICNMDCKFCFANWREKRKQLPLEKVIFIIDKLKEYGVEAINLTGGDPLVRKDIVEICKHCRKLGITPIISSTTFIAFLNFSVCIAVNSKSAGSYISALE